ncbi:MAG TPA: hypothetical protein VH639_14640 [Bryobacteraceae bacterium]|jgi:hypothetical protein
MRTTIRLDDDLLRQARDVAAERGVTLNSLIEAGLKMALMPSEPFRSGPRITLPVSRAPGGVRASVDLGDCAALLDLMEGRRFAPFSRDRD